MGGENDEERFNRMVLKAFKKTTQEIKRELKDHSLLPRERKRTKKIRAFHRKKRISDNNSPLFLLEPLLYTQAAASPAYSRFRTTTVLIIIKVTGRNAYVIIKDNDKPRPGFVTGSIESGDTDMLTARYETREEAGIDCEEERFSRIGYLPHRSGNTRIAVFFLEISSAETGQLKPGDEQEWLRLATSKQIEKAIREGRILEQHGRAWELLREWIK